MPRAGRSPKVPDGDQELLEASWKLTRALVGRSRGALSSLGLSAPQFLLLRRIADSREVTAGRLSRELCVRGPTVTGFLDALERRGWVRRRRDAVDRRQVSVALTPSGDRRVRAGQREILRDWQDRVQGLPGPVKSRMAANLTRLAHALEQGPEASARPGASPVRTRLRAGPGGRSA